MNPVDVFKEAFKDWRKNIFAVVPICAVIVLLESVVSTASASSPHRTGWLNLLFAAEITAVLFLEASLSLLIVHFFHRQSGSFKERVLAIFKSAREKVMPFTKGVFLLVGAIFVAKLLASYSLFLGRVFFSRAGSTLGSVVFLSASTVSVVLLIGAAWYGFFFSFAPLIMAFEKKKIRQALELSKARIKLSPLRYLTALLFVLAVYLGAGLLLYFVLTSLMGSSFFLTFAVDSVMTLLIFPLLLAVWHVSYRRLTDLKESKNSNVKIQKSKQGRGQSV